MICKNCNSKNVRFWSDFEYMICKKCGHNVTKHDVIYADNFCEKCHNVKTSPYCPCGEKL